MLEALPNLLLNLARSIGNSIGKELVVDVDEHSIDITMADPETTDKRCWDSELYHKGNLFHADYATPLKIVVDETQTLDDPDTAEVVDSDLDADAERQPAVISTDRHETYFKQDLASQLLTPEEHMQKIIYLLLGIAALLIIVALASAVAAGWI